MACCAESDEFKELSNEIENFKTANDKYGKEKRKLELEKSLNVWKETPMHIGIIGRSGVGKSTFINIIRGITADDEDAAETGAVETTKEVGKYTHPKNKLLHLYDLPGVGTRKFPKENYFTDFGKRIDGFDMFILMTADRFVEDDVWLAREIRKKGKNFLFVRTKIHQDVENERKAKPQSMDHQKTLDRIRTNCEENLQEFFGEKGLDQVVYLIDNYDIDKYDMNKLMDKLIEGFPYLKRDAFIFSLFPLTQSIIDAKEKSLRKRIWMISALTATVGAIPVPGTSLIFDATVICKEALFYQKQLGLGKKHLKVIADTLNLNYDKLVELAKMSAVSVAVTSTTLLACCSIATVSGFLSASSKLVPIIGSIVGATVSFSSSYAILRCLLKKMVNESKNLNEFIANYNSN